MLGPEVHRRRLPTERVGGDRGEEVLRRVLLHMIGAAGGIHHATHLTQRERRGKDVHDPLVIVDHVDHRHAAEHPGVVRLPARGGVEGGLIEDDAREVAVVIDDGGRKVEERGGGVVEAEGHCP